VTPAIYREPLCPLKVLPLAARSLRTSSESVTPPSSLILAPAPDQNPPDASVLPLYTKSLQVAASPCWELALPVVISAIYIWLSRPIPRRDFPVLVSVSSWKTSVSQYRVVVRLTELSLQCNFYRGGLSRLQSFLNV